MRAQELGPYVLLERIAAGGMAEVYLAKRLGPGGFEKRVAIKKILPHLASNLEFVDLFISEARLAARLDHANIVQVFDFGEVAGTLFLAMEYVPGITAATVFKAALRSRSPVPVPVVGHIGASVLRGLDYVHCARDGAGRPLGLVHRDVSPSNILVGRSGEVKLGDFGIARDRTTALEDIERGRLRGKLGYMAPEQVIGAPVDQRADLFATGIVLAELFMAKPLFAGGSELDVLLRIRDGDLARLYDSVEVVGRDAIQFLARALTVDQGSRYQTAREMLDALVDLLSARGARPDADALVGHCEASELFVARQLPVAETEDVTPEVTHTGSMEIYVDPLMEAVPEPVVPPGRIGRTSPPAYRVRLADGEVLGPMSYPRLVELLTAGRIDGDVAVSTSGRPYQPLRDLTELTRFVTSQGLSWDAEELKNVAASGDLSRISIPRLFFRLGSMSETGVLHLRDGNRRKKVYFVEGQPEFVGSTDRDELLGEHLVRTRVCLRMEVDMALAMLPRFGGHLGDALVGLGILRPIELFRAISAQVRARLLEIFRWRNGEFVYAIGMRSHEESFPIGANTFEIIGQGVTTAYRASELEALLSPFQEKVLRRVPIPRVAVAAFRLPKRVERVFEAIDGRKTLAGILARESMTGRADPEEVYQAVYLGLSCEILET